MLNQGINISIFNILPRGPLKNPKGFSNSPRSLLEKSTKGSKISKCPQKNLKWSPIPHGPNQKGPQKYPKRVPNSQVHRKCPQKKSKVVLEFPKVIIRKVHNRIQRGSNSHRSIERVNTAMVQVGSVVQVGIVLHVGIVVQVGRVGRVVQVE